MCAVLPSSLGRLKAALGMHERSAASIIGIHPGSVSDARTYLAEAGTHVGPADEAGQLAVFPVHWE